MSQSLKLAIASFDMETHNLIQETFRREFNDCTITHRLHTVMDSSRYFLAC